MLRNKAIKRFTSILLSITLLLNSCPLYALDDIPAQSIVPGYKTYEPSPTTASEYKYFKIYDMSNGEAIAEGSIGGASDNKKPLVPDGRLFGFEFLVEQTQETRLELLDENLNYLGLIACGDAEGQWGILGGTQWYSTGGGGTEKPIANYLESWDGTYWDYEQQDFIFPGQDENGNIVRCAYLFHVRFQPTDPNTQQYTVDLPLIIDYSDEAVLDNAQLRGLLVNIDQVPCTDGEPVYMPTGNFIWDYTDFAVYGAQPLEFTRHYNAQDKNDGELGFGWRHSYMYKVEKTQVFASVTLANGSRLSFNIKGGSTYMGAEGIPYTLENDGSGYLLTDLAKTKYYFNDSGYITAIEDVVNNRTDIIRNGAEIVSVFNNSGTLDFTYNNGKISQITDQTGRSVSYAYDGSGDLISFLNADNDTISYTYDNVHHITEISDFNNNTFLENTYDNLGRVSEQYVAGQGTSYFTYDFVNRVSTITAPDNAVRKYYYDIAQRIIAIEDIDGQMEYGYTNGRLTKKTDRLGNETVYDHDENGNTISITHPDNTEELFEYNELNLVTKATARDNTEKLYGYDGQGNP